MKSEKSILVFLQRRSIQMGYFVSIVLYDLQWRCRCIIIIDITLNVRQKLYTTIRTHMQKYWNKRFRLPWNKLGNALSCSSVMSRISLYECEALSF